MIYLFLGTAVWVMNWLIIIRVFLSFIPHNPYNTILRYIYEITEPLFNVCRKLLPEALRYPLDFTPMVSLLLLQIIYRVLAAILHILF